MRHKALKYFYDIRQACDLIEQFTRGKSFEEYLGDALLRSAVERQFMIVGEALFQALNVDPSRKKAITDARRIINFRHVMVHGYAAITPATVWGVVQEDLATLRREVETLLVEAAPKQ